MPHGLPMMWDLRDMCLKEIKNLVEVGNII